MRNFWKAAAVVLALCVPVAAPAVEMGDDVRLAQRRALGVVRVAARARAASGGEEENRKRKKGELVHRKSVSCASSCAHERSPRPPKSVNPYNDLTACP